MLAFQRLPVAYSYRHQRYHHFDRTRYGWDRGRMAVTGAGITSGGNVVSTTATVITIAGTITTLTASAYVFTLNPWLSLHTTTPGTTGAAECTGGTGPYARQAAALGVPASGIAATTGAQNFLGMPSATVGFFGVWSVVSAGTYEGGGP